MNEEIYVGRLSFISSNGFEYCFFQQPYWSDRGRTWIRIIYMKNLQIEIKFQIPTNILLMKKLNRIWSWRRKSRKDRKLCSNSKGWFGILAAKVMVTSWWRLYNSGQGIQIYRYRRQSEPFNRRMYAFNTEVDRYVYIPITSAYILPLFRSLSEWE